MNSSQAMIKWQPICKMFQWIKNILNPKPRLTLFEKLLESSGKRMGLGIGALKKKTKSYN